MIMMMMMMMMMRITEWEEERMERRSWELELFIIVNGRWNKVETAIYSPRTRIIRIADRLIIGNSW